MIFYEQVHKVRFVFQEKIMNSIITSIIEKNDGKQIMK